MELTLTVREEEALAVLAAEMELAPAQVFRQGLRLLQLVRHADQTLGKDIVYRDRLTGEITLDPWGKNEPEGCGSDDVESGLQAGAGDQREL